jgi:hypothetical protein
VNGEGVGGEECVCEEEERVVEVSTGGRKGRGREVMFLGDDGSEMSVPK